ncbi:TRAP transporter substrate-binding protein [Ketogulonicigenium vulgare]|nr:TRAP transporter substrate-binding protein [Ketogulonicigenium vulgare]ADO43603.1 putative signal peptide protein [Ketogulonicigenium vulgare Y25]AOZ55636.1 TRAP dicarboxylate transporter-DctP subunit [Ketogulonicigenium vulgare]
MQRRTVLKLGSGFLAASALGRPAFAAGTKWDFADEYVASLMPGRAANFFISRVNERFGDQLEVVYQGGGALGYKSADHFDAVETGAVQAATTLVTQLNGINPLFNVSNLPFLVKSIEESRLLWDTASPYYGDIFEEYGQVLLFGSPSPPAGIHSKNPIDSVEALRGLRIRTFDSISTRTMANAGCAPLQIAWTDVVPQLSTGALDAMLTSADGGASISCWDYLSNFTLFFYSLASYCAHVNRDAFEALPPEVQEGLREIGQETVDFAWTEVIEVLNAGLATLEEHGMNVQREPNPAAFAQLQSAGNDARTEWLSTTGDAGAALLADFEAKVG